MVLYVVKKICGPRRILRVSLKELAQARRHVSKEGRRRGYRALLIHHLLHLAYHRRRGRWIYAGFRHSSSVSPYHGHPLSRHAPGTPGEQSVDVEDKERHAIIREMPRCVWGELSWNGRRHGVCPCNKRGGPCLCVLQTRERSTVSSTFQGLTPPSPSDWWYEIGQYTDDEVLSTGDEIVRRRNRGGHRSPPTSWVDSGSSWSGKIDEVD
jgi:hypothetical protein